MRTKKVPADSKVTEISVTSAPLFLNIRYPEVGEDGGVGEEVLPE